MKLFMNIESIKELYTALNDTSYGLKISEDEKKAIELYLNTQLNKSDNAAFIAELNAQEQAAIKGGKASLCNALLEQYYFTTEFTKSILKHLTEETLNQEGPFVALAHSGHDVATPLAMAIVGLINRLDNNGGDYYFGNPKYAIAFRDEVIHYLIDERKVNVDNGFVSIGHPLSVYCLQRSRFCYELYYPLAEKIIDKTQNVNLQSKGLGITCVHLLATFKNTELLEKVLLKKPDLSIKGATGIFKGVKKTPLLIATEHGRVDSVRLLLAAKASPNDMPERVKIASPSDKILSPYQTAVETQNDEIITAYQTYSKQNNVRLRSDLDSEEWERRESAGILQSRGEATLETQLQMMPFKDQDHILNTIKEAFGLNCYVKDTSDRSTIERALNILLEENTAKSNPAFTYFSPIRERLLAECRKNSNFSLFVQSANRSQVIGCYNRDTQSDFYLQGGLSYEVTVSAIAHEMGHFFGFAQPNSNFDMAPEGFLEAFKKDRANWGKNPPHSLLNKLINAVESHSSHYENTFAKNAEYFTRACVQFPMDLGMSLPHITDEEFNKILETSMPHTWAYFKLQFMQDKITPDTNLNKEANKFTLFQSVSSKAQKQEKQKGTYCGFRAGFLN